MRVVVVAILCLAFACALVTTRNVSATLPPLKPGALRVDSPSVLKAETERPKTIVITKPTIVGSAVSEGASSTVPPSTSSEPIVPEGGSAGMTFS